MDAIWWVVILVIVVPIVWFVFKAVVGATVKPEVSGKHFLKQRLQQMDVNAKLIPDAGLEELVQNSLGVAEWMKMSNGGTLRTHLVDALDGAALNIQGIMSGNYQDDGYYCDILKKYGVIK